MNHFGSVLWGSDKTSEVNSTIWKLSTEADGGARANYIGERKHKQSICLLSVLLLYRFVSHPSIRLSMVGKYCKIYFI